MNVWSFMLFGSRTRSKYIVTRGITLFLSVFILLSIVGGILYPGFGAIRWILHISFVPELLMLIFLGFLGVFMLTFAINPKMRHDRKSTLLFTLYIFILLLFVNSVEYYVFLGQGKISTIFPIPFTLFMLVVIFVVTLRIHSIEIEKDKKIQGFFMTALRKLFFFVDFMPVHLHINVFTSNKTDRQIKKITKSITSEPESLLTPKKKGSKFKTFVLILIIFMVTAFLFTLGQIFCYGNTKYLRKVDAVVVFGASVYVDGRMSLVLEDRIRTGCTVFKECEARYLVCSGGPGPGKTTEAQAMRNFAIAQGIDKKQILVDDNGLNTFETVGNLKQFAGKYKLKSFLAVSHFYHLARIKMTCESAGITAYTVPASQTRTPSGLPFFVVREVFALWFYFFKTMMKSA